MELEANGMFYKDLPSYQPWMIWKDQDKYELTRHQIFYTDITPDENIETEFYSLYENGTLILNIGYRCNGASGPTIDTKNTMRGAFAHDAFYQMMREGQLGIQWKNAADRFLQKTMLEDGEDGRWNTFRAGYFYQAVNIFGWKACRPKKVSAAKP